MNIFITPDWDPNAIGDKKSEDLLLNLATLNTKKLKRQSKKRKLKEKVHKEDRNGDKKPDKKENAIRKRNLVKQEPLPLVQIRTEGKRKTKPKRKKNVQNKKGPEMVEKLSKAVGQETKEKRENESDSNYKAQQNYVSPKMSKFKEKFLKLQAESPHSNANSKKTKTLSLRQRMMERLRASRFRFLNENMYTSSGKEAENYFKNDPESFQAYHDGFTQQVTRWPLNPLDVIIKSVKKLPENYVIADFGCGDAKLAQSVKCKVHSFDLIAINEHVTACNMAHVPLENDSVNVAVFCLSLMGTNLQDYIIEANRVLKMGGALKIVEVESRFDNVDAFIKDVQLFGFSKTRKDSSHDLFQFMDFKKSANCKQKQKLPELSLHPCLYKKR